RHAAAQRGARQARAGLPRAAAVVVRGGRPRARLRRLARRRGLPFRPMIAGHDVAWVRADNPSPLTLGGSNTWLLGREPCYVVDPGPLLEAHVEAVAAEAAARGGAAGIVVTHSHADHVE